MSIMKADRDYLLNKKIQLLKIKDNIFNNIKIIEEYDDNINNFSYIENDNEIIITRYRKNKKIIKFPNYINDKPVTILGNGSIIIPDDVEEIIIPSNIKIINKGSFMNTNIKKLNLMNELTNIGESTFYNCNQLEKVYINCNQLEILEMNLFMNCSNLKSVYLNNENNKLNEIKSNCFKNCIKLETIVNLPKDIKIDYTAFENCDNLIL